MPQSHFMISQRPSTWAEISWTEKVWARDWSRAADVPASEPAGFGRESAATPPDSWSKSAWAREPWCELAPNAVPPTCDPWSGYWAKTSWNAQEPHKASDP